MLTGRLAVYEGWDLPNSTAWDSTRWSATTVGTANAGVTINVQGGGGRFALAGVTAGYAEFGGMYCFPRIVGNGDFDLVVDMTLSATVESYPAIGIGDFLYTAGVPLNGIALVPQPSASTLTIQRRDNGTQTDIGAAAFTWSTSATRLRFRREGSTILGKAWLPTTAEPPDWTVTNVGETDGSNYRGGQYGSIMVGITGGNVAAATTCTFDNLYVYELRTGVRRHRPILPSSATLTVANATAIANPLVTSGDVALAASSTVSAFPQGSARNTTVATGTVSAFNLAAIQSLIAANSTATAFALSVPGGAALAVATSTASAFPQSSTRNTVVATGTVSAFNLAAIQSLIAASSTVTAFNLANTRSLSAGAAAATANNLVSSTPFSATAAVATSTATSFNLSNGRALGLASSTAIANVIGLTGQPVAIYAQVQATGLDMQNVLIGAEPFGSGRTPTAANSTATAFNLSYTDSVTLVQAAATAAAQFLSRTTFLPTTANVTAVAFGIVNLIAAQSANASAVAGDLTGGLRSPVAASANAVAWNPHNQFYGALAATASAVAFGGPGASSVSTFALAATLAYSLGNNSLTAFAATGLTNAFPLSAGDVLSYASVSVLAQNLGLVASPVLSAAAVAASAFPLNVTPTSSMSVASASSAAAGLGTADALSAASSGAAAGPLAGTRQETAATASVLAYGLVGASSPLLAAATALTVAYGLGNLTLAAGTMAAAVASVQVFNAIPFILASLGQAPAMASAFLLSELSGGSTNSSTATTSAFGMGRGLTPYVATVNGQANDLLNRALLTSMFASAATSAYGLTVLAIRPGLGKVRSGAGSEGVHTGVGASYGVHTN